MNASKMSSKKKKKNAQVVHTVSLRSEQTAGQRDHCSAVKEDLTQQV